MSPAGQLSGVALPSHSESETLVGLNHFEMK